jgi:hypothetical protein
VIRVIGSFTNLINITFMAKFSMKAVAAATVIGGAMVGAVSASAALNLPTQNCSYMFNTNMKLGSRGTDVMNLQKVLNAYPQTRVAESGAGSPGMETTYFGPATRAAVNKFHALHLVELGISAPTGNAFAGTRGLLNAICQLSGNPGQGNPGGNTGNTGPVSAMLAASQPTGMIVQGQSGARLADIVFTGNGTITSVQLQRTGVSTDSTLTNVYLYDGNTRITDAASVVTGGYINFNAPTGLFSVNGSRTITVRADVAGSTNGQSVGVRLNSMTANGAVSTFSNVVGNSLQIANVTTASVDLNMNTGASTVNAGTVNHILWSSAATVSTRDVNLRAATFKFVGSAPVDFASNLSLYVDGTKIAGPSAINAANNNKLTFDLGNLPYLLKTGSHTIEVRGDIVKGSARTYTFSIENVADLMLEDSNLAGVNVSATEQSSALTQSNSSYTTVTISTGSVTVNLDPSFNATQVTGGATNVPVGQFTLKAYGEDVKVNTLQVTFATTTITTLNNVSLYVNGGQVGTSQNFLGTAPLTYTLGSSLIIPANTTVTLTVKADIVNSSNAAYSSGTVAAVVGGTSSNAQGMSSNEILSVAASAVTGNTLTVSSGAGTFARTSGFTAVTVAPNTSNVKIGSFALQAGSAEDIKVNTFTVNPVVATYAVTNLSNLRVVSNGVTLGTPVGNPASGTSTFSFADVVVPANSTRTFDVYADIGSATSGSVTAAAAVTYRGAVSNTSTTSSAAGVAITSAASTLSDPALGSASPVAQFVVGGSTFGVATFNLKTASAGTVANVRELRFTTTGTDAIESITVGGKTASVIGGGTTTVAGLNISIGSTGTDVPVTVKFSGFQNATNPGSLAASIASVLITLGHIEATSGSGSVITNTTPIASNTMTLVGSKPTVSVGSGAGSSEIVLGAENKIGEFTVTADASGKIGVASTSLTVSTQGITNPEFTSPRVADGNTTISGSAVTGSSTLVISFDTATSPSWYEIPAGQSKTFSVYATVAGAQTSSTVTPYVTTRLTSGATFKWVDILGGNSQQTGALIYNFPTGSYTTSH